MAKFLIIGTFGSDDPTRATLPFITASGALDRGHEPTIVLLGEAAYLLKASVVDAIHGFGFPPLRAFMSKMTRTPVPIYI